jgi:hypothetical protein
VNPVLFALYPLPQFMLKHGKEEEEEEKEEM